MTVPSEESDARKTVASTKKSGRRRLLILAVVVIGLMVSARVFDLGQRLREVESWIEQLGPWAPLVFIGIYVAAVLAAIPGSPLTAAAGVLFGSLLGVIYVSIAATIGASLAFLVSRYFARDAVANWLSGNRKFRRLDRMTEEHGASIIALTRLVPLFPFNLLNYGFGLTRVHFLTYAFWSWLCMLPGTVLYVVGADAIARAVMSGEVPWTLVGVLAGAVVLLVLIVHFGRRKLAAKEEEAEQHREGDDQEHADG
jgi:uncharacterized membrane protein YdjX (TVP38/TMEM64 family)